MGGYFSEALMSLNFVLSVVPIPFTTAMIAIEIPAAIRPYSMAVAPDSSLKNDLMINFMAGSDLVDVRGTQVPPAVPVREHTMMNLKLP
jgi:hypothetical protein